MRQHRTQQRSPLRLCGVESVELCGLIKRGFALRTCHGIEFGADDIEGVECGFRQLRDRTCFAFDERQRVFERMAQ